MVQERPKFSVANLTEEEKSQREININALYETLSKMHPEFDRQEAEEIYNNMQQAAIDSGKSIWKFYKEN